MAKKPIQKKSKKAAKKAGGRRKKGKRSYKSYISKVVKGLKGKFKMSKKAMAIVNSFAADLFDRGPKRHVSPWVHLPLCPVSLARPAAFRPHRIAGEAGRLAKHTGAKTLSSAGMQAACRLQGAQGTRSRAPLFCQAAILPRHALKSPSCPASWRSTP